MKSIQCLEASSGYIGGLRVNTNSSTWPTSCTWAILGQLLRWTTGLPPHHGPASLDFLLSFQHTHSCHWPLNLRSVCIAFYFCRYSPHLSLSSNVATWAWLSLAILAKPSSSIPSSKFSYFLSPSFVILKHLYYVIKCYFVFSICCLFLPPRL